TVVSVFANGPDRRFAGPNGPGRPCSPCPPAGPVSPLGPVAPAAPVRPWIPCAPRAPRAPWSSATAFLLRSAFGSEPLITCGEPTLFFGTSLLTAAYELPAIATARQAIAMAGRGRYLSSRSICQRRLKYEVQKMLEQWATLRSPFIAP